LGTYLDWWENGERQRSCRSMWGEATLKRPWIKGSIKKEGGDEGDVCKMGEGAIGKQGRDH